ncbi:MAG: hypothetical protein IJU76_02485 [Desulfovibrionaceae bacterium]|nr:hypothetical protein [Desulfovibrionaceae bacterium]
MSDLDKKIHDMSELIGLSFHEPDVDRIKKMSLYLQLQNNDPFLSILVLLEGYFKLCKSTPTAIKDQISTEIANKYKKYFLIWLFALLIIFSIIFISIGKISYDLGKNSVVTISEIKRDMEIIKLYDKRDFLESKTFLYAYEMFKSGELENLIYCKKDGWHIEDHQCIPDPVYKNDKPHIYPWRLPY